MKSKIFITICAVAALAAILGYLLLKSNQSKNAPYLPGSAIVTENAAGGAGE